MVSRSALFGVPFSYLLNVVRSSHWIAWASSPHATRAGRRGMGASSSRAASWEEARGSRCCRCFEDPGQYGGGYGRTGSVDSLAGRRGGEGSASSRGRRRRRRHRSSSVSSVESIDEELDRRGRTRERRGSAPKWEVVLEVRRPDGNYTRLPSFILSAVRRTAQCSGQPAASAARCSLLAARQSLCSPR
jgi:hypothetical protein